MIEQKDVEKAVNYIRDHAKEYSKAKANRMYLQEYRKSKKALLVQRVTGTIQERESFAYAHPDYQQVLEGLKEAVEIEERIRWEMKAAEIKVELYRTQEASNRRIDGVHR